MATETVADLSNLTITDTVPPTEGDSTDTSTCRVCGKGIDHLYSGKGRRPVVCEEHRKGSATNIGSKRSTGSGDVGQAVAALEQGYQMVAFALTLLGAREAAATLSASIPQQNALNANFLASDKELVKTINKVGRVGGRYAFYGSQAMLLGPVVALAYGELSERFRKAPVEAGDDEDIPFKDFADV